MSQPLASFRDLKGIGPATEARLHESGIYSWEALAVAATALAGVRGEGESLREVANAVVARRTEEEEQATAPSLPDGERLEAFVVRMALTGKGEPQRSEVTHVRTMADQTWAGWTPTQLVAFIEKHAGIQKHSEVRVEPAPREEKPSRNGSEVPAESQRRRDAAPRQPVSSEHVVVLDAGKAIGGSSRDINLVITNTRAAGGDFGYRATLAARRFGPGANNEGWTVVGSRTGTGSAASEVALGFPAIELPAGIHSLQLRLEVNLPAPTSRPPALALA